MAPFPPRRDATHGGGRAIAELLLRLSARTRVALLYLRHGSEPPLDGALAERCEIVRAVERQPLIREGAGGWGDRLRVVAALAGGRPYWAVELAEPALARAISDVSRDWRPDVAQIEYGIMAQYLSALPSGIPRLVVVHEPAAARIHGLHPTTVHDRIVTALDRSASRRYEPRMLAGADGVVVFTQNDRALLGPEMDLERVHVIPLGFDATAAPLDPAGSSDEIVFVGSFIHPPNVDAARFLVFEILPALRRRRPDVVASVVGASPPPDVLELAEGDKVVVTGRVPAVAPYLDRAGVVVAPLRVGGGMRVKVLETLSAGKALVATPLALSGIAAENEVHALVREGAEPLAEAIASLLADRDRRVALGRAARAWASAQPGWEATADAYERLYASLLGRRA